MVDIYGLRTRQAQRIAADGMGLIMKDFDEINIELSQIVMTLIVNLYEAIKKGLLHNKKSIFAAASTQIINIA